jgi:hypothetical protein
MLGYRKRPFLRAHALLQILRSDLAELDTLKELQKLLLVEIVRAEKKIRDLKSELRSIQETGGSAAKKRSQYLKNRVEGFRKCAYIWRCFGDAIAFLYMDKFALKQTYYSTENTNPKQGAGFIAHKEGLLNEIAFLEVIFAEGISALLVDLTNTIRYGDVCLMGADDPYLIEVKASKSRNSRSKKQKRSLEKLHTFLKTDKAQGMRGFSGEMRRQTNTLPERTYADQINKCITEALKVGRAICQPESGLHYIVTRHDSFDADELLGSLNLKAPWVFILNDFKRDKSWAPYLPFTLSIENREHLWGFIQGKIFIIVLVEVDTFPQIAIDHGYSAKFDRENENFPLRIEIAGMDDLAGVSSHMLKRAGMEFVSPEWLVLNSIATLEGTLATIKSEHNEETSV